MEKIDRRMLKMELPSKRQRGRPKKRFMDVVRKDKLIVGMREDNEDRRRYRGQEGMEEDDLL